MEVLDSLEEMKDGGPVYSLSDGTILCGFTAAQLAVVHPSMPAAQTGLGSPRPAGSPSAETGRVTAHLGRRYPPLG